MGQSSSRGSATHRASIITFARSSAFAPFVSLLDNIGAATDHWLFEAHMPPTQRDHPEGLAPLAAGYRFLELAARNEGLEDLGVIAARRTSAFELGAFGAALTTASTVQEYLNLGIRLVSTLSSGGTRFWLRSEGRQLRVHQQLSGVDGLGAQIADVFTLALTITTLQQHIGSDWLPGELRLRAGDENLLGDWEVARSVPLLTHQPTTSFTLPFALLNKPIHATGAAARPAASSPLRAVPVMPEDPLPSLEQLVRLMVSSGITDIETTAEAAGSSSRTLQRVLALCGTNYRSLVNAARLCHAQQRLSDTTMRIIDIATELGYTDASNFARAFQRQAGESPLAYRRGSRQHQDQASVRSAAPGHRPPPIPAP